MNDKQKLEVFNNLFMSGDLDPLVVNDLIMSYKLTAEVGDCDSEDLLKALRVVIKYYSTDQQYNEFLESVEDTIYLPIDQLKQGTLYYCDARNFTFGEWSGSGFIYKHQARPNHSYYDNELHYDSDPRHGTVRPYREATKEEFAEYYCS